VLLYPGGGREASHRKVTLNGWILSS
jgi:hypothetical protein